MYLTLTLFHHRGRIWHQISGDTRVIQIEDDELMRDRCASLLLQTPPPRPQPCSTFVSI